MGGDHGPAVVIPAACQALENEPALHLHLVGDETQIKALLPKQYLSRVSIRHTSQVVAMDELPSVALRSKKDSSLRVAVNLVKEKVADACVSAGNTGALMATAHFVLKTLPHIHRPAIIAEIPTKTPRPVHVLDLGANVDSNAENLLQFAIMGSVYADSVSGVDSPRVALLNNGSEDIKGNEQVKQAAVLISQYEKLNYIGFIEGDGIFSGSADVVVCDGFVGNVALKTIEGVAKTIIHYLKQAFQGSLYGRFLGLLGLPILRSLRKRLDPQRYNGASLIGLRGIVVKSHGAANVTGLAQAIQLAVVEVQKRIPERIEQRLLAMMASEEA